MSFSLGSLLAGNIGTAITKMLSKSKKNIVFDCKGYKLHNQSIDCIVDYKVNMKNDISDNPVEVGYNFSDNVFFKPTEVHIEGVILPNKPFINDLIESGISSISSGTFNPLRNFTQSKISSFYSGSRNRAQEFEDGLMELRNMRHGEGLFSFTCFPSNYYSKEELSRKFCIEDLHLESPQEYGDALLFKIKAKQVIRAESDVFLFDRFTDNQIINAGYKTLLNIGTKKPIQTLIKNLF